MGFVFKNGLLTIKQGSDTLFFDQLGEDPTLFQGSSTNQEPLNQIVSLGKIFCTINPAATVFWYHIDAYTPEQYCNVYANHLFKHIQNLKCQFSMEIWHDGKMLGQIYNKNQSARLYIKLMDEEISLNNYGKFGWEDPELFNRVVNNIEKIWRNKIILSEMLDDIIW